MKVKWQTWINTHTYRSLKSNLSSCTELLPACDQTMFGVKHVTCHICWWISSTDITSVSTWPQYLSDESPGSDLRTQCEACELPSRNYYTYITHIWRSLAIQVPPSPQMTSWYWALSRAVLWLAGRHIQPPTRCQWRRPEQLGRKHKSIHVHFTAGGTDTNCCFTTFRTQLQTLVVLPSSYVTK